MAFWHKFKKHETPSEDFVDISIGRVWFRVLTHDIVNWVMARSTIYRDVLNNAYFFELMEKKLLILDEKEYKKLSVKDGDKIRLKLKSILERHGLIEKEEKKDDLSKEELDFLNDKLTQFQKLGDKWNGNSGKNINK